MIWLFRCHHINFCYTSSDSSAQVLYTEVFFALRPEGIFCNLEHVASPAKNLHQRFLFTGGKTIDTEDKSNKLLDMRRPTWVVTQYWFYRCRLLLEVA